MVNHYGRNISEKVLNILMEDPYMEVDSDVYLFVTRRFHLQLNNVLELEEVQKKKMKCFPGDSWQIGFPLISSILCGTIFS